MYLQRKQPEKRRSELALITVNTFNRGKWVAKKIVLCEISWRKNKTIPDGKQGRFARLNSLFNDENIQLAVREYLSQTEEGTKH